MHRTRPMPRIRIALAVLTLALSLVSATAFPALAQEPEPAPTTVIVVRHAEKAIAPPEDPELNLQGLARTGRLVRLLEKSGVTAVYASQYQRTRQTVEPVAKQFGLEVQVIDAKDPAAVARAALTHAGGVVLIAGHSNTVGAIIEALGGGSIEPIGDDDYDNVYVVTIFGEGRASVLRLSY